ncbi:MlaC/ttg2D family ABC transporter substrate-binding protein [Thauera linaloolentis]|uniref:Toluene tolerance family protein n=1 Tax=Thauera linaloolentis (strain DSM 12138 / JCM 21573 / CCUG 41526 / CIP 105981 / IAM 15112 / NBRC 102519 / 47Lol) TaxID=1123367 RepID=N6ZAL7_THAL4|nr:ABC transporter substrate-binding protein [Thauera linaloolentis]ENO89229.1 toluene tolerance family protein [Thauera linaloolentis 47Lol = DSM 12138]MCM8564290.1 ABC transporter substrate-binding protein [Thauera linaloolentis]
MNFKKLLVLFCFLAAGLMPMAQASAQPAPDVLVREVTNEVLEIVRADRAIQAGDSQRVIALVHAKVLPHFDFRRMTMLAVGRDWRDASAEQQGQLTEAFRTLLVRTYSNALTQYRDQTIDFKPTRFGEADKRVQVRTEVRQSGAQPIGIDYMLEKSDAGWKVFDVIVAGVSLVTNYRGSFTQEIRSGGIDGLIKSLEVKNRSLEAEQKPS